MSAAHTILVTGGAGFIGATFVKHMLETSEYHVVNLDALTYAGNLDSLLEYSDHARHTFVHGDVRDGTLVTQLLNEHQCSAVVHFAAESHVDRSIENPLTFADTNVMGTLTLLDSTLTFWKGLNVATQSEFRFVHISTDEVYGALSDTGTFTEDSPYAPNSPYAASKAAGDHFVRAYQHTYGLPIIKTHCSNNYGPNQFPEKLIPLTIRNALAGKPIPIYGDGQNVRDWIHVNDHCDALQNVLENGKVGETYNIGAHCERSNLDVVYAICDAVDELRGTSDASARELVQFVADRPGHDFRYAVDAAKIHRELRWSPKTSFEQGIRDTVSWNAKNPYGNVD